MKNNSRSLSSLLKRRDELGEIGALDFLIELAKRKTVPGETYSVNYEPFFCTEAKFDGPLEKYAKPPKHYPPELELPAVNGMANDYSFLENRVIKDPQARRIKASVVVLTYNRAEPLSRTLAGLARQSYPKELFEVIVTDDGGSEDTHAVVKKFSEIIDVKYVWHKDVGFTPAMARNNGVGIARNDLIVLLDVDMLPSRDLIESYARYADVLDRAVLIGPRKYIDINSMPYEEILNNIDVENRFVEIVTNNSVANKLSGKKSVDWRLEIFDKTSNLKIEKVPFRTFASGNVAFSKASFVKVGRFDERFKAWGYEDTELGFRFFNGGKYIIPVMAAMAYHQEPVGGENETDRSQGKSITGELFGSLCPYYRHLTKRKSDFEVPTVSIYIPAYNAEDTICDAIDSALNQTYRDLEVCICDDGSTDNTLSLLERYFKDNHRVRWVSTKNGGIGAASNAAVNLTRGIYIGQLDSDDYLARDVVEKCVAEISKDPRIGLVYTSYENEYSDGRIEPGYNYPAFTREKLMTAMIVHHFRLFKKLYWCRTDGFDEIVKNAVDYDMYLKLAEVCEVRHLNIRGYRRRIHGANTSVVNFAAQVQNAKKVINHSVRRMNLPYSVELLSDDKPEMVFRETMRGAV